jgi:hypothetical protein
MVEVTIKVVMVGKAGMEAKEVMEVKVAIKANQIIHMEPILEEAVVECVEIVVLLVLLLYAVAVFAIC